MVESLNTVFIEQYVYSMGKTRIKYAIKERFNMVSLYNGYPDEPFITLEDVIIASFNLFD